VIALSLIGVSAYQVFQALDHVEKPLAR
jgi:hypothetical protein